MKDKIINGVFHKDNRREYLDIYKEMVVSKAVRQGREIVRE